MMRMPEAPRRRKPSPPGAASVLGPVAPAGAALSPGERIRLAVMAVVSLGLVLVIIAMLSGALDGPLGALAGQLHQGLPPGVVEDGGTEVEGGEAWEPSSDGESQRPVAGAPFPDPKTVPDPGEDESWRTSKQYLRYREYVARLVSLSDAQLAAEVDPAVTVRSHVWPRPREYQGKVIRLMGHLVRREPKADVVEDLPPGVAVKWEVQIVHYATRHIYTLDLIGECPIELVGKPVTIDAIFFDIVEYFPKRNVLKRSAFFIGRDLRGFQYRAPSGIPMAILISIPVLLVVGLSVFEVRREARARVKRDQARRAARQAGRSKPPVDPVPGEGGSSP